MSTEYERKYLINGEDWKSEVRSSKRLAQGYISSTALSSVRVRIAGNLATLTVKSKAVRGIARIEVEAPIPLADATELLAELVEGVILEKTRHILDRGPYSWTVDEFHGDNAGLVLLEIEAPADFAAPALPNWVGTDVTLDERFQNSYLGGRPYQSWASGNQIEENDRSVDDEGSASSETRLRIRGAEQ